MKSSNTRSPNTIKATSVFPNCISHFNCASLYILAYETCNEVYKTDTVMCNEPIVPLPPLSWTPHKDTWCRWYEPTAQKSDTLWVLWLILVQIPASALISTERTFNIHLQVRGEHGQSNFSAYSILCQHSKFASNLLKGSQTSNLKFKLEISSLPGEIEHGRPDSLLADSCAIHHFSHMLE